MVISEHKYNHKKHGHLLLSEHYLVTFMIKQFDGFWKREEVMYFTANKGEHDKVIAQWNKDYAQAKRKFLSIHYQ